MKHFILPPHLAERLSAHSPVFHESLLVDGRIRERRRAALAESGDEVTVYDAHNSMSLPGEKVEGEGPEEAQRVRNHAEAVALFRGVLPTVNVPELVVNYGEVYPNAFFDGQYLVFGEGDQEVFGDFSQPLEVFAHEFAHKIIDMGPKLEYAGQPGALNESLADVIGVCIKKKAIDAGVVNVADDWRIGAELFLDKKDDPAMRDMEKPGTAYDNEILGVDPQPAHMDRYVETFTDNGGVHINSGIPNRAFVSVAEKVDDKPWRSPLRVWLRAMAKSAPDTDFQSFADLTEAVAADMGEAVHAAVVEGWKSVGITVPAAA